MAAELAAKKELAVHTAIQQLDEMIADLNDVTGRLCGRTAPVRRQEPDSAAIGKAPEGPSSVPIVQELDGFRMRLYEIRVRVGNALDQMEI